MPLIPGKSKRTFEHNLKAELSAGKPQKQALAIAYAIKRRAQHKYEGGVIDTPEELTMDHKAMVEAILRKRASSPPSREMHKLNSEEEYNYDEDMDLLDEDVELLADMSTPPRESSEQQPERKHRLARILRDIQIKHMGR